MNFFTTTSAASRRAGNCIVVGVYAGGKLGHGTADIDTTSKGTIRKLVKDGDISGLSGSSLMLTSVPGIRARRVLVVGLGKSAAFGVDEFRQANETVAAAIKGSKISDLVSYLPLEDVAGTSAYYLARHTVETVGNCLYTFTEMKSGRKKPTNSLKKVGLAVGSRADAGKAMRGAEHAHAIVTGMTLARDLGNLPPNICTPAYLARSAQKISRQYKSVQTKVLGEACRRN